MEKVRFYKAFFPKKRTIILSMLLFGAIFVFYNTYLIDYSFVNVQGFLKKIKQKQVLQEAKKVQSLLETALLIELTDEKMNPEVVSKLEFAKQLLGKATTQEQLEDISFFLREVLKEKEVKEGILVSTINNVALLLYNPPQQEAPERLKREIDKVVEQLSVLKGERLQEAYLRIGNIYIKLKNWQNAERYLTAAIDLSPGTNTAIKAKLNLGYVLKYLGRFTDAKKVFTELRTVNARDVGLLCEYQIGDMYYEEGNYTEAAQIFEKIFQENPDAPVAQFSQFRAGYTYFYELEDTAKAIESMEKISQNSDGERRLATYANGKVRKDIVKQYREAGYRYLAEGYKLLNAGKYNEALTEFETALKIDPKDALSYIGKALGLLFLRAPDQAYEEGLQAMDINPKDPNVMANFGFICYDLGLLDKAIEQHLHALKLYPRSAVLNYNVGTFYAIASELSPATNYLHKAVEIEPNFTDAYNNLGYVLWFSGDYRGAQTAFEQAALFGPQNPWAHYNLGLIKYAFGSYDESRESLRKALALKPDLEEATRYLLLIKRLLGY